MLKWRINYPTLAFWANLISDKWDTYTSEFNTLHSFDMPAHLRRNLKLPKFRAKSDEEYLLFRNFFQIIDLISLDIPSLQFSEKLIVASVIYILLGLYLRWFSISNVVNDFTRNPYACSNYYELNIIYNRFISKFLQIELNALHHHILFTSFFFNMRFEYNLPNVTADVENQQRVVRLKIILPFYIETIT